jgi:ATP-dependent DNA helicase DinG
LPRQQAWIFASATLGDDDSLSWFTQPTGLQAARVLRVASPFDYGSQAAVWVPRPFPAPNDARHSESVADLAARVAQSLCGRTLVLTTTLRALKVIGERLEAQLSQWQDSGAAAGRRVRVLVQGDAPKSKMVEALRDATPQEGVVVVGSASFWEGVDVPGDALQAVVIDKLPFPPPGDPLVQARMKRIEEQGGNAFAQYHLAEAAVALKQGSGRLIRSVSDRGLLLICDPRLASASYGRRLMQAIPPMRRLSGDQDFSDWLMSLGQITKTATTPDHGPEIRL